MRKQKGRRLAPVAGAVAVLLFAFNGASGWAREWTPDERAALGVLGSACEALRQGKIEKLRSLYHERFVGWDLAQPLPLALTPFMADEEAFLKSAKSIDSKVTPVMIAVVGETAVVQVTYKNTVVMTDAKEAVSTGRWTSTLVKQGGRWLFLANTYIADK